jgi:hypothetical protein
MQLPLRKLLTTILSGRAGSYELKKPNATEPKDTCAYCRQERPIVEVGGPLSTGGVFVCAECARRCISLKH